MLQCQPCPVLNSLFEITLIAFENCCGYFLAGHSAPLRKLMREVLDDKPIHFVFDQVSRSGFEISNDVRYFVLCVERKQQIGDSFAVSARVIRTNTPG